MARINNNILTTGAQGAVGRQAVYKEINGKQFLTRYPDMSQVQYNEAQKEYQDLFGRASAYASEVNKDPVRSAAYKKLIRADKRKRGTSVYHAAHQAFMEKYSRKLPKKMIEQILQQYLEAYELSTPQAKALEYLIAQGKLTNAIYQHINNLSKATATRHLQDLVNKGIIANASKGAGAKYTLVNTIQDDEARVGKEEKELI